MLTLRDLMSMSSPYRMVCMATAMLLLQAQPSLQQTYTTCNPTQGQCPADTALGKSISVDFRTGQSSAFYSQGNPTFGSDGASFTVAKSGDSPQLNSKWYIMFGHVDITMKAAPGAGIVSSSVLQSDDLDEIDWEWLGAKGDQVQSNYFGKGQTTSYNRGAVHGVSSATTSYHKYSIDWTQDRIVWSIDGTTVRVLYAKDANGQFPQTPMQLKIGAWSGGDPSNAQGTIQWADGPTDYTKGPFTMVVQSVAVTDYSTGTQYKYGDTSGAWTSIQAVGGTVNGNSNGQGGTVTAPAITSVAGGVIPLTYAAQTASEWVTPTVYPWVPLQTTLTTATGTSGGSLPSGWSYGASGKLVRPSAAAVTVVPTYLVVLVATCVSSAALLGIYM
ncbi:hypothetical protein AMS68_001072 [Peltaster fructicola]|uniref:chitinase n=1 Tax=Peltaster fructicola TaxID=286661 RepID=A0A6H0XLP8_9PEZI|nr:hypothetical protein AMS68_001072 [Peltaster fructicola]